MSDDILDQIDNALARNRRRFDPLGGEPWDEDQVERIGDGMRVRPARAGGEEGSEPAEPPTGSGLTIAQVFAPIWEPELCRGCRRVALVLPEAKLCGPCSVLPSCGAERSNERTGRVMVCFRPAGHEPPTHEDLVSGSQWVGEENQVEALRPEGAHGPLCDCRGCATMITDGMRRGILVDPSLMLSNPTGNFEQDAATFRRLWVNEPVRAADQPEPDAHPVDASSDTAPDVPARSNPFSDLYAALRARARRGGTKP